MHGIDLLVHDTHEGSGGQWLKLCRFQSSNPLELLPHVFPKLLYQSFLSEIGQKLLHVRSRTLASQIDRVYTTTTFSTSSSGNRNFTCQWYLRICIPIRTRRISTQNSESACIDSCGRPGPQDTLERQDNPCSRFLSCGPEVAISQQVNTRQCTYLALVARNK